MANVLHPPHPERVCWGCDKYCPADDLACGNGTIRTAHPCELFGDDWLEWSLSRRDGQMLEPVQQPFLALSQDVLAYSKT
jgi:hypothetical protein